MSASNPARGVHETVAGEVWPDGGTLECKRCTHSQRFSASDAAGYLRRGWPRHCDTTMRLVDEPTKKVEG